MGKLKLKEDETLVVFRKFKKGGDIIALFPTEEVNQYTRDCMSYMHIGQHGAASYNMLVSALNPPTVQATPEEYADLKAELERIGYKLVVRRKFYRGR